MSLECKPTASRLNSGPSPRLLVIEDDLTTATVLVGSLKALGYGVIGPAETGAEALVLAELTCPDLVLADVHLKGDLDGIQTVQEIRKRIEAPVVYLTASTDRATLERAKLTNPFGFLSKPFRPTETLNAVEIALYRFRSEAIQRLYERAIGASASGIFIIDARQPSKPIIQVNPAFERMTGYCPAEIVGKSYSFFEGPNTEAQASATLKSAFATLQQCRTTILHYRKDATTFWNEVTLSPVPDTNNRVTHFVGVQHDVTVLRNLETQLRQAQKLEAIGQLAAGIAHEINTPLQYIGDNNRFIRDALNDLRPYFEAQSNLLTASKEVPIQTEVIRKAQEVFEKTDADFILSELPQAINQSLEGIERVTAIVGALKEFSHPGNTEKTYVDLNQAIQTTLIVCRNEWKHVAEVVTHLADDLPRVRCFPNDVNQMLLNLIVNASHAIAEVVTNANTKKGQITILTRRVQEFVEICVQDTGCGIPENIQHRVFDPFFTTKPVGKGTGQGLAITWNVVVEKHGGTIKLESQVGRGTTFLVRLPIRGSED